MKVALQIIFFSMAGLSGIGAVFGVFAGFSHFTIGLSTVAAIACGAVAILCPRAIDQIREMKRLRDKLRRRHHHLWGDK